MRPRWPKVSFLDSAAHFRRCCCWRGGSRGTGRRRRRRGAMPCRRQRRYAPERSSTPQSMLWRHAWGVRAATGWGPQRRDQGHCRAAGPGARPQSTCTSSGCATVRGARTGVSSRPNASTAPTRSQSAASSASPQASTARFAVCQSQSNSAATSATGRASRPTAIVAQRPARAVNAPRAGAIRSSTSVNDPTSQLAATQHQRCLCQMRRTGRPNAGQIPPTSPQRRLWTTPTRRSPHTPAAAPRCGCARLAAHRARRRRRGPPRRPDRPATRRYAWGSLPPGSSFIGVCQPRFWRPPPRLSRTQCPLISEEPH